MFPVAHDLRTQDWGKRNEGPRGCQSSARRPTLFPHAAASLQCPWWQHSGLDLSPPALGNSMLLAGPYVERYQRLAALQRPLSFPFCRCISIVDERRSKKQSRWAPPPTPIERLIDAVVVSPSFVGRRGVFFGIFHFSRGSLRADGGPCTIRAVVAGNHWAPPSRKEVRGSPPAQAEGHVSTLPIHPGRPHFTVGNDETGLVPPKPPSYLRLRSVDWILVTACRRLGRRGWLRD
jgi:hypothetical protein